MSEFESHISSGSTTLARCWVVERQDGTNFGFTDHDQTLSFDGITFKASSGMTARTIMSGTGLSVDNSEAMGALSDAAIAEADIEAGRFDGATVKAWLVNWAEPDTRSLRFSGTIGELRREGGAFHAELRGLTEMLNQPQGRVYQTPCSAVLGDANCQFDVTGSGFSTVVAVEQIEQGRRFKFANLIEFEPAWFERGRLRIQSGIGQGLVGAIKRDRFVGGVREIEVWQAFLAPISAGDSIQLNVGCDKRSETCRAKFNNMLNFQGFPDIPGDDWLASTPVQNAENNGGSLRRGDDT